ncbi:MAG: hypothetical protein ACREDR_14645, partial [Blastocatellia bacterium]
TCTIDLGQRAPVVVSASPASGFCSVPQDLLISGSCFILANGSQNVTSVYAVDTANPTNIVQSVKFAILTPNLIDALFDFDSPAGGSFLVFATGPNGTSRNLTSLPGGVSSSCPLGNEQGVQVTFTCIPPAPQPVSGTATVSGCFLNRNSAGRQSLTITGANIKADAVVTINGLTAKKTMFENFDSITNAYGAVVLKGGICGLLPGTIVITNPGEMGSSPFRCNSLCQ